MMAVFSTDTSSHTSRLRKIGDLSNDVKESVTRATLAMLRGAAAIDTFAQIIYGAPWVRSAWEMQDYDLVDQVLEHDVSEQSVEQLRGEARAFVDSQTVECLPIQLDEEAETNLRSRDNGNPAEEPTRRQVEVYLLRIVLPSFHELFLRCYRTAGATVRVQMHWQTEEAVLDWATENCFGGRLDWQSSRTDAPLELTPIHRRPFKVKYKRLAKTLREDPSKLLPFKPRPRKRRRAKASHSTLDDWPALQHFIAKRGNQREGSIL